jgi:stage IV sporulation protein FB
MWDPFSWSFPLGRVSGIAVRVHLLFPVVALGLIMRAGTAKDALPLTWVDATLLMSLLFLSVLLHEFGHCAGARYVEGDAHQVLLWPLGGLASIDVPHTPKANFIATAAGPAVNLVLCAFAVVLFGYLTEWQVRPSWNIVPSQDQGWYPFRVSSDGAIRLYGWDGTPHNEARMAVKLLAWLFWVNLVQFVFNVFVIGFPLDGGRMFQCILWPRMGFRASMQMAVYAGFVTAIVLFLIAMVVNEWLLAFLAIFIYITCRQQWILLETGAEDSLFGYDFTQGYTSLERGQEPTGPRRKRPNFVQRWLQKRAAKRLQREQETREAEERRMDELLEKVQREGIQSLTDEERRFLKRVSDRYRNRQ